MRGLTLLLFQEKMLHPATAAAAAGTTAAADDQASVVDVDNMKLVLQLLWLLVLSW